MRGTYVLRKYEVWAPDRHHGVVSGQAREPVPRLWDNREKQDGSELGTG